MLVIPMKIYKYLDEGSLEFFGTDSTNRHQVEPGISWLGNGVICIIYNSPTTMNIRTFDAKCVKFWLKNSPRSCCMHREKHFYFEMLITFEPNVAQRSVASQNDHKSKACLPEASNAAFTMYRRLKRRLRRLQEAPFQQPFFWHLNSPS